MKLRVAVLQINSLLGQPQQNILKCKSLLSSIPKDDSQLDLVVLSELAITGYNFASASHIKPFLESPTQFGPSLEFAQEISRKHNCFTVIDYPECSKDSKDCLQEPKLNIYNSCAVFDRQGNIIHNYRKTFLYETDQVWGCLENPQKSFTPINVEFKSGKEKVVTNFGICMDLNPYKFEAPFQAFEFSRACYQSKSQLVICPMAWLSPNSPSLFKEQAEKPSIDLKDEPCKLTINYWILRFFPFLSHKYSFMPKWWSEKNTKVNVICCNRVGMEDDILYGGSSCILEFNGKEGNDEVGTENPSVKVLDSLSQCKEGIMVKEIEV